MKETDCSYVLYTHGDYFMEWIKCVEVIKTTTGCLVRSILYPQGKLFLTLAQQLVDRCYLILNN